MNLNGFAEIVRDEIVKNGQSVTSLSEMECEIRDGLKELGAVWLESTQKWGLAHRRVEFVFHNDAT